MIKPIPKQLAIQMESCIDRQRMSPKEAKLFVERTLRLVYANKADRLIGGTYIIIMLVSAGAFAVFLIGLVVLRLLGLLLMQAVPMPFPWLS